MSLIFFFFFFNDTATTEIYTLSLHDALPILAALPRRLRPVAKAPLFRHPIIGPLTRLSGAIPVHRRQDERSGADDRDRKSTRLNSSHSQISYAVFCLKKKKTQTLEIASSSHA